MNIFSWIGRRIKLTEGSFWTAWFGGDTWTGRPVTPEGAMKLSAWWACVKLYGEVTGAMPFKLYERTAGDDRVEVRDHPVAVILASDPNIDQTTQEFWGGQAASLTVFGNAYAEKLFSGTRLVALQTMPFEDVWPSRDNPDRVMQYAFTDRGKREVLPADKVFHTRGFGFGRDMGLSPIAYARETLGGAMATEEAAARVYGSGMRATGFFTTPPTLTEAQRKQFHDNYVKPVEGAHGEGKQIILPPGFDHKTISIPPKDAEMLLSRRFNVEDVCRWAGVPPILVGHAAEGQTMWGSGVENILLAWLTLGLDAHLSRIEKSVNKRLLNAAERQRFYAEFNRDSLLRADSAARAEFVAKMVQNAQMTPNEGRKKINLPPMTGGDQLLVNSTLVPLTTAGQKPSRVQPAPGQPIPE